MLPQTPDERPARPLWRVALTIALLPLAGALLSYLALDPIVLPRAGLGTVSRITALGAHLASPLPDGTAVFLGSSIVREGIDADLVEQRATGWRVENLAISGCSLSEVSVLLPRVLAAKPAAVVLGITLGEAPADIALDKAYAYARGGFPASMGSRSDHAGIGEEAWAALQSTAHEQRLHFRSAPLTALDDRVRRSLRAELRQERVEDWRTPFEMIGVIEGPRLERHLRVVGARIGEDDRSAALRALLVQHITAGGARPILLLLPVHPKMGEPARIAAWRTAVAATPGATVIDASALLPADYFADAVHPDAEGRARLSTWLGARMPAR